MMNSGEQEQVTGEIENISYRDDESGYTVASLITDDDDLITVVGILPLTLPGERLVLWGRFITHKKYGFQFDIERCDVRSPASRGGLVRYLGSGIMKGIGQRLAHKIVEHFGDDTIKVLDEDFDRLLEVSGIRPKKMEAFKASWEAHRERRGLLIFLYDNGIGPAYAERIIRQYGPMSETIVRQNPYQIAEDVSGIGFITADKIAMKNGIPPDDAMRIKAGLLYVLRRAADDGHVLLPKEELLRRCGELLKTDKSDKLKDVLSVTLSEGLLSETDFGEKLWGDESAAVYLPWLKRAEELVAQRLLKLIAAEDNVRIFDEHEESTELRLNKVSKDMGIELAPEQSEAVKGALNSKLVVVTGGPGTGKTTLVRMLVEIWEENGELVSLGAPTGRAAKRLCEATAREAKTLHRLLEYEPRSGRFARNAQNPLDARRVVVDEISMVDLPLFGQLLSALPDDASLILVGDANQLPSVGPGSVLRDMLASKAVRTVELKEVFRQAAKSLIVQSAHKILQGEMPKTQGFTQGDDFYFFNIEDQERAAREIVDLVARRIPDKFDFDPLMDIQVLCPMHKGTAGDVELGAALQQALNPFGNQISFAGRIYRRGDRVMQLKNDYDRDIFNGDLGRIADVNVAGREVTVRFDANEHVFQEYELEALMPAYAVTVHKSQGSEYPAVVIPLVSQHYMMLQRNLLYTAVTRGKKLVVLVGSKKALAMAVKNDTIRTRYGALAQRLK